MNKNEKISFAEMLEESIKGQNSLEGKVVLGKIIAIKNDKVIVDVGLKSEGRLFLDDVKALKETDAVSVGDTLEVYVDRYEDKNGEPILSIEKAKKEAIWISLEKKLESGETIEGNITGRTKGGFSVDINGTTAFLPSSQVDLRLIKDITPLLNIPQPFKLLKMDKIRNNIVVSRRAVLEAARNEARGEIMSKLEEGTVIEGVVKNIMEYGAFVDIGGIDGLLHVTDMSWKRVSNPTDVVNVGDKVTVQILKFNKDTGRISLGMKQLTSSPWENIEQKYKVGEKYKGTVSNITDYGVFVALEECIEGLAYISELSWLKKSSNPLKNFEVGQEVEAMVLEVNSAKKKISLGLKQCQPNPWKEFEENHPVGTKLEGVVKNITEFGIFVGVTDQLDGMVHMSDVSWKNGSLDDQSSKIEKGQKIEVVVLSVDPEKERIGLGVKRLENDSFTEATKNMKKGDVVTAEIKELSQNGIVVSITDEVEGFIKTQEISLDKSAINKDKYAIGDKVEAIIIGFERAHKRVQLSIKMLEKQREKEALAKYGSSNSGATLGDILGKSLKSEDTTK